MLRWNRARRRPIGPRRAGWADGAGRRAGRGHDWASSQGRRGYYPRVGWRRTPGGHPPPGVARAGDWERIAMMADRGRLDEAAARLAARAGQADPDDPGPLRAGEGGTC